jgi:hypothetical protein
MVSRVQPPPPPGGVMLVVFGVIGVRCVSHIETSVVLCNGRYFWAASASFISPLPIAAYFVLASWSQEA